MVAQNIFFGILAAIVAISALRMVTTRNIVHAALYLVAVLAGLGALYVLLTAGLSYPSPRIHRGRHGPVLVRNHAY